MRQQFDTRIGAVPRTCQFIDALGPSPEPFTGYFSEKSKKAACVNQHQWYKLGLLLQIHFIKNLHFILI